MSSPATRIRPPAQVPAHYIIPPSTSVHLQTDENNSLGATGYIGGDALHAISKAHPEYEWTCLVRNSDKGALVAKQYPKVRLVYGDLDSSELIAEEATKADIVCSKSCSLPCFTDGLYPSSASQFPNISKHVRRGYTRKIYEMSALLSSQLSRTTNIEPPNARDIQLTIIQSRQTGQTATTAAPPTPSFPDSRSVAPKGFLATMCTPRAPPSS